MKLAVMQPYFFPYIGYFQLLFFVDKFVIYDDVNFIKRGWINRNNILVNGVSKTITVPLLKQSQNKLICETEIVDGPKWRYIMLQTLKMAYKKAPQFDEFFPLVEEVINMKYQYISQLAARSIIAVSQYLDIQTNIIFSSQSYQNSHLTGESRILDICKIEQAGSYLNTISGTKLYHRENFDVSGIKLNFLKTGEINYEQFKGVFVPNLSIIDILMFNSPETTRTFLEKCQIV